MAEQRGDRFAEVEERYSGYTVYDRDGDKIGKVDDLFVDENDNPEYIGVKMGLLGLGGTALIPLESVRVDEEDRRMEVSADKDTVKNGPSFDDDQEITSEYEERVRNHYGLGARQGTAERGAYGDYYHDEERRRGEERGGAAVTGAGARGGETRGRETRGEGAHGGEPHGGEPHGGEPRGGEPRGGEPRGGEPRGRETRGEGVRDEGVRGGERSGREHSDRDRADHAGPGMTMGDREAGGEFHEHDPREEGVGEREDDLRDTDELRVQRSEEELRAGTREREAGAMRVRKRVRTDREQMRVPKKREEVSVERVPVEGRQEAPEAEIGEDEVVMPVVEEEVVVEKRPVVKEEVRLRKDVVEDEELVEEDVRKEEVDIEDATEYEAGHGSERGRGPGETGRGTDADEEARRGR